MRIGRDAVEARERKNRCSGEKKGSRRSSKRCCALCSTSVGNGHWALRALGIPSVARIGREAIPPGEESAPISTRDVSQFRLACKPKLRSSVGLSAQTHGPPRFGSNASKCPPAAQIIRAGRASSTTPNYSFCASFLRAPLSHFGESQNVLRSLGVGGPLVFPVEEGQR